VQRDEESEQLNRVALHWRHEDVEDCLEAVFLSEKALHLLWLLIFFLNPKDEDLHDFERNFVGRFFRHP